MAKEQGNVFGDDPFKAPVPHATNLAVAADATVSGINPEAAANSVVIEQAKDGVRYKNGRTMPISAKRLTAAARIKSSDRRTFSPTIWSRQGWFGRTAWRRTTSLATNRLSSTACPTRPSIPACIPGSTISRCLRGWCRCLPSSRVMNAGVRACG